MFISDVGDCWSNNVNNSKSDDKDNDIDDLSDNANYDLSNSKNDHPQTHEMFIFKFKTKFINNLFLILKINIKYFKIKLKINPTLFL